MIVYVELEQVAYTMFLDAFVTELKLNGGCPEQEGSGVGEGGGEVPICHEILLLRSARFIKILLLKHSLFVFQRIDRLSMFPF